MLILLSGLNIFITTANYFNNKIFLRHIFNGSLDISFAHFSREDYTFFEEIIKSPNWQLCRIDLYLYLKIVEQYQIFLELGPLKKHLNVDKIDQFNVDKDLCNEKLANYIQTFEFVPPLEIEILLLAVSYFPITSISDKKQKFFIDYFTNESNVKDYKNVFIAKIMDPIKYAKTFLIQ